MALTFYDKDEKVLFENIEPVDDTLKTSRNIIEHVADTHKILTDAGCKLKKESREEDIVTLGRIYAALLRLLKTRHIPLRSIQEKAKELARNR